MTVERWPLSHLPWMVLGRFLCNIANLLVDSASQTDCLGREPRSVSSSHSGPLGIHLPATLEKLVDFQAAEAALLGALSTMMLTCPASERGTCWESSHNHTKVYGQSSPVLMRRVSFFAASSSEESLTEMNPYGHQPKYRWVPLKPDFLGAWKSVWLKHYLAYPIFIISLIIQRNLATKIWAKWESGLTAVWLKWDPPVSFPPQPSEPALWGGRPYQAWVSWDLPQAFAQDMANRHDWGYVHYIELWEEGANVRQPPCGLSCMLPPIGIFSKVGIVIHCSLKQREQRR